MKGAFSEAAGLFLRHTTHGKKLLVGIETKHGKGKVLSTLAHTLGRAAYLTWGGLIGVRRPVGIRSGVGIEMNRAPKEPAIVAARLADGKT